MNQKEQERRARLLKQGAERLPDIKKRFEEAQKRHFNSNFAAGGKDEKLVRSHGASVKNAKKGQKTASNGKNAKKHGIIFTSCRTRPAELLP